MQKFKHFIPNLYQLNQNECDKLTGLNDNSSTQDGQLNLLPLIGESRLAACSLMKKLNQHSNQSESDDKSCVPFCNDQKINQDTTVECK